MTKFLNKLKKNSFWPNFGGKEHFSRKSGSVTQTFTLVSSTMPKFNEK